MNGTLISNEQMCMRTPAGPELAPWLHGFVKSAQVSYVRSPASTVLDLKLVESKLSRSALAMVQDRSISLAELAHALRCAVSPSEAEQLLEMGAGPQAFSFLHHVKDRCLHKSPFESCRRILKYWPDKAEIVFAKLVHLNASQNLRNPEELSSWISGMGAPRPGSDGFATMLADAVDLVDAGHKIYIEEHPEGLGDIVNSTTRVAYQHKRVTARNLSDRIIKAAEQLEGFLSADGRPISGAPAGYAGIIQLDIRGNEHFNTLEKVVAGMPIGRLGGKTERARFSRLDEIQILMDNAIATFNPLGQLINVVKCTRDL